jgi:predicted permease
VSALRVWLARARDLVRERQVDRDLRAEIAGHIAEATEEYIRQGRLPEEARRAALRSFGGVAQTEEAHRDARSFLWLDLVRRDLRHAARSLRRSPTFTVVAVLTLAVGIGAVTALFSVLDGVVLKPLAFPDSDRIVSVANRYGDLTGSLASGQRQTPLLTGGDAIDIAAERGIFDAFAHYHGGEVGVQLADRAVFVGVQFVHPDFFRVFGIAPVAGRPFNVDDAERSVVVSEGFASRNFGSAVGALDQSVFIEDHTYLVVGVMPSTMRFPERTEVWAAAAVLPKNRNRSGHNYRAVGRLASGMSIEEADARLDALAGRLAAAFPVTNHDKTFGAIPLRDNMVSQVRPMLLVLMGAVVLLLLIACANVANLMLARGEAHVRELGVRAALGASRGRIIAQLLMESLMLAGLACGLGLLVAYGGTRGLLRFGTSYVPLPRLQEVHMDWRVLSFSIALSLVTTVVCGLAPALRASRISVTDALNQGGTRGALGGRSRGMRSGLVVAQIALSCMLAVDAGLLLRSFVRLTEAPLGFTRDGVLVIYAHAPARGSIFDQSGLDNYLRVGRFFDDLLGRLRRQPNVVSAGAAMGLPTGQYDSNGSYAVEGRQSFTGDFRLLPSAGFRLASPRYFQTIGVSLLRGREFDDGDVYERTPVAIISQSLARQQFPNDNPLGHRIMCGLDRSDVWMTIVGVVGDVRQDSPASAPVPQLYMPLRQHPYTANEVQVVIRTRIAPELMIPTAMQIVHAANPEVATKFTTLAASVDNSIAAPRFRATLVSTFAAVALLLALTGVYAVMSYTTAQRTAEFGLRVAMGARAIDVVRLVLAGASRLTLVGVVVGLLLALATSRIVSTMLFGVTTTDAATYAGVLVLAMPLVAAASAIPALSAARVDPLVALRAD